MKTMQIITLAKANVSVAPATGSSKKSTRKNAGKTTMSEQDKWYFGSEFFTLWLKSYEDRQLAKEYGELISKRKAEAYQLDFLSSLVIKAKAKAEFDGFSWSFGEVKCLFKGWRSEAIRRLKTAKSRLDKMAWSDLIDTLECNSAVREALKVLNKPVFKPQKSHIPAGYEEALKAALK